MGGIKEKILGAHRAGIIKVLPPYSVKMSNTMFRRKKTEIKFAFVRDVGVLEEAFGKEVVEGWKKMEGNKDRLGEEEVVMMSMVMMMSGMGVRVVVIRMCLREGMLYGLEAGYE